MTSNNPFVSFTNRQYKTSKRKGLSPLFVEKAKRKREREREMTKADLGHLVVLLHSLMDNTNGDVSFDFLLQSRNVCASPGSMSGRNTKLETK